MHGAHYGHRLPHAAPTPPLGSLPAPPRPPAPCLPEAVLFHPPRPPRPAPPRPAPPRPAPPAPPAGRHQHRLWCGGGGWGEWLQGGGQFLPGLPPRLPACLPVGCKRIGRAHSPALPRPASRPLPAFLKGRVRSRTETKIILACLADYFSRHSYGNGLLSPFIHPPIIPFPVPMGGAAGAEEAAGAAAGGAEAAGAAAGAEAGAGGGPGDYSSAPPPPPPGGAGEAPLERDLGGDEWEFGDEGDEVRRGLYQERRLLPQGRCGGHCGRRHPPASMLLASLPAACQILPALPRRAGTAALAAATTAGTAAGCLTRCGTSLGNDGFIVSFPLVCCCFNLLCLSCSLCTAVTNVSLHSRRMHALCNATMSG